MRSFLLLSLAIAPVAALASDPSHSSKAAQQAGFPGGALTYEVFEAAIEHADLATCPKQFDPELVFCRLTVANDMAHVFVFDYGGNQSLLAVKSFELDEGLLSF